MYACVFGESVLSVCVCVCVRVCVRACVPACVRAFVSACVFLSAVLHWFVCLLKYSSFDAARQCVVVRDCSIDLQPCMN